MEKTFLMVKPDGIQRGLVGEIVQRFEQKGFQLLGAKLMVITKAQAERHYEELQDKPFFGELISFITSGPVFAMVWAGDDVISMSRQMMGKTKAIEAAPGTIRGDYAVHTGMNLIHGSDSPANAAKEISNFFQDSELLTYDRPLQVWI